MIKKANNLVPNKWKLSVRTNFLLKFIFGHIDSINEKVVR